MRLVHFSHVGDESCSFDSHEPFEYRSVEDFQRDIELALTEAQLAGKWAITFAGMEFELRNFIGNDWYAAPYVYTLDEWFDVFKVK